MAVAKDKGGACPTPDNKGQPCPPEGRSHAPAAKFARHSHRPSTLILFTQEQLRIKLLLSPAAQQFHVFFPWVIFCLAGLVSDAGIKNFINFRSGHASPLSSKISDDKGETLAQHHARITSHGAVQTPRDG